MGLDVDSVSGTQAIERLSKLISDMPHGGRSDIADDITDFVDKMIEKYEPNEKN